MSPVSGQTFAGAFGITHLDAIKSIDGVEVVSLVSRELDKTREIAAKYGRGHRGILPIGL